MVLEPIANGTDMFQAVVPVAIPLPPVAAFDHLTEVMPWASVAVPSSAIGDELVATEAAAGVVMTTPGGVVS
jgi:hypothetical protein